MRNHGFELPLNAFQVGAVLLFVTLVTCFYLFLVPLLCVNELRVAVTIIYSVLVGVVTVLHFWCTLKNPADPGVLAKKAGFTQRPRGQGGDPPQSPVLDGSPGTGSPGGSVVGVTVSGGATVSTENKGSGAALKEIPSKTRRWRATGDGRQLELRLGGCCMVISLSTKGCLHVRRSRSKASGQAAVAEEDRLFCSICDVQVRPHSKHCRACDKCVDHFDHHCRWLNNCIGRSNYRSFLALVMSSLLLLCTEVLVGAAAIGCCWSGHHKCVRRAQDAAIGAHLSPEAVTAIVALCSLVALLFAIPLAELLCFHCILMYKGLTTYDYVTALRDRQAGRVQGDSLAPTRGGQWPGVAVCRPCCGRGGKEREEAKEAAAEAGSATAEKDEGPPMDKALSRGSGPSPLPSRAVRISAWRLAFLPSEEARGAVARARLGSSILRPLRKATAAWTESGWSSRRATEDFKEGP